MGVAVRVVLCVVAGTAELCCVVVVAELMPLERQQSLHKLRLEAVGRQAHSKQLRAQLRDLQPAYSSLTRPLLLGCGLQPRCSDGQRSKRHGTGHACAEIVEGRSITAGDCDSLGRGFCHHFDTADAEQQCKTVVEHAHTAACSL